MSEPETFKVGDIIQIHRGTGVPKELEGKYFRVLARDRHGWKLSLPYIDAACTRRYHIKDGRRALADFIDEDEAENI
jgi:hypothetical protein